MAAHNSFTLLLFFAAICRVESFLSFTPIQRSLLCTPTSRLVNEYNSPTGHDVLSEDEHSASSYGSARSIISDTIDETNNKEPSDSLLKFSQDVNYVLHELRGMPFDPCIPSHLMCRSNSLSYSKTWTLDDWEYHNSRKRYFRYLWYFPQSRLVRRLLPQQGALLLLLCIEFFELRANNNNAGLGKSDCSRQNISRSRQNIS